MLLGTAIFECSCCYVSTVGDRIQNMQCRTEAALGFILGSGHSEPPPLGRSSGGRTTVSTTLVPSLSRPWPQIPSLSYCCTVLLRFPPRALLATGVFNPMLHSCSLSFILHCVAHSLDYDNGDGNATHRRNAHLRAAL